jgi:hypothetical protein
MYIKMVYTFGHWSVYKVGIGQKRYKVVQHTRPDLYEDLDSYPTIKQCKEAIWTIYRPNFTKRV